jgi:hypothetical protein
VHSSFLHKKKLTATIEADILLKVALNTIALTLTLNNRRVKIDLRFTLYTRYIVFIIKPAKNQLLV